MKKVFCFTLALFFLCGCRPSPYAVKNLSPKSGHQVPSTPAGLSSEQRLTNAEKKNYLSAKRPSFALIKGYYRLPKAQLFGSAKISSGQSFGSSYENIEIKTKQEPYVITPVSGSDAESFAEALNQLLDDGVRFKELSMADALAVSEAEKNLRANENLVLEKVLGPGVDYLVTMNEASDKNGPILIGRVIAKNGDLMAFRVLRKSDFAQPGTLVIELIKDSIKRF